MKYVTSYYWNAGAGGRKNEDSLSLQRVSMRRKEAAFLLVCDGVGGLDCGEWASGFVAERMTRWFWERAVEMLARAGRVPRGGWTGRLAHSALRQLSGLQAEMEWHEKEQGIRCGTTCTMAVVCGSRYLLIHSGDSRAYLIGKKERVLTRDHQQEGRLARCMGDFGFQKPDIAAGRLRKGEVLLLCTDGYCGGAPEGFFQQCFAQGEGEALEDTLNRIGRFLLAHGEKDNLSAVALKVV